MTTHREVSDPRLLEFADIVKLEITHPPAGELAKLVAELKPRGVQLIAENVETPEDFESCVALGLQRDSRAISCSIRRPSVPSACRPAVSARCRLVASLSNEQFSIDEIEPLISQNVSMSYHVLRCINSSYYSLPRKVDSIRQAIVILGIDHLRQLCSLLCLQGFDDRPPSLFLNAMTRARMCEQLGRLGGARDTGPFFITGSVFAAQRNDRHADPEDRRGIAALARCLPGTRRRRGRSRQGSQMHARL